jgi:DNA repair protein RadC
MTRALFIACDVVGLSLLDHIVIAKGGAESLRELAMEAGGGNP